MSHWGTPSDYGQEGDNWLDSIRKTKEQLTLPRRYRTDIGDDWLCKSPEEEEDLVSKVLTMPVKIAYLLL